MAVAGHETADERNAVRTHAIAVRACVRVCVIWCAHRGEFVVRTPDGIVHIFTVQFFAYADRGFG